MESVGGKILVGLARNVRTMNRRTAQLLAKQGLTVSQFGVLEALFSKGPLRIGEVQDIILSSTGTMPTIVNNLERRGFISKAADPKDKRATKLHLTPEGEHAVREVLPHNLNQLDEYCSRLSEAEQVELIHLLKKLGGR